MKKIDHPRQKAKADPRIDPKENYGRQTPGYKYKSQIASREREKQKAKDRNEFFKMFM